MGSFTAIAQLVIDATYAQFGTDAKYYPPPGEVGSPTLCRLITDIQDQDISLGNTRGFARGNIAEVRVSEIPQPIKGGYFVTGLIVAGVFVPGNDRYTVASDPKTPDGDVERLVLQFTATLKTIVVAAAATITPAPLTCDSSLFTFDNTSHTMDEAA
jgi:hypothetical protein